MSSEIIAWIDVESGGKSPEADPLLEFAAHLTDLQGNSLGSSYSALLQTKNLAEIISGTSESIKTMHMRSGLWQDLWSNSQKPVTLVEKEAIDWLQSLSSSDSIIYFGGNSINLDRRFLEVHMTEFYKLISHRSVDVTSLSLFLQANVCAPPFQKGKAHRALPDVMDSIDEYRHYIKWSKASMIREANSLV